MGQQSNPQKKFEILDITCHSHAVERNFKIVSDAKLSSSSKDDTARLTIGYFKEEWPFLAAENIFVHK